MEIFYRRDTGKSYMIAQGLLRPVTYEDEMLKNNELTCILPYKSAETNDSTQIWYDITGRRSLQDLCEEAGHVTVKMLYELFTGMERAYREMGRFLIRGEHIHLSPETIYTNRGERLSTLKLCYLPLEEDDPGEGTLLSVMEYLLTVTDHREEEVTKLCYELFEKVQSGETDVGVLKFMVSGYMEEESKPESEEIYISSKPETTDLSEEFIPSWEPLPREPLPRNSLPKDPLSVETYDNAGIHNPLEYYPVVAERTLVIEPEREISGEGFFPGVQRAVNRLMEQIRFRSLQSQVRRGKKDGSVLGETSLVFDEYQMDEEEDLTVVLTEPVAMKPREKEPPQGLFLYEGEGEQDNFTVERELFTVGSGKDNNGVIESGHVSRRHGRIHHDTESGEFWVEDLNSLNGTVVNGNYIPPHKKYQIYAGDRISFAGINFMVK